MKKQKKADLEQQLKFENINKGMAFQRGLDIVTRCLSQGLPIILTDRDLSDLKTSLAIIPNNVYSGEIKTKVYIKKLLEIYSNPSTIRTGLRALEKIYGLRVIQGSDLNESLYADQIEKVGYFRRKK